MNKDLYAITRTCLYKEKCVLIDVHLRLNDIERLWMSTLKNYHEPTEFRTYLNSTIQEIRNSTFILQSNKSKIPDFDSWYKEWQRYFKEDEVLRWIVDARNTIVKRGDLEKKSITKLSLLDSYSEPPRIELEIDPFIILNDLVKEIRRLGVTEDDFDLGYILVERKWIVNDLNDYEVLEALGYAFGEMIKLLNAAHNYLEQKSTGNKKLFSKITPADFEYIKVLPHQMTFYQDFTTMMIKISGGEIFSMRSVIVPIDEDAQKVSKERYGLIYDDKKTINPKENLREFALSMLETSKKMLEKDKFLLQTVFLLGPDGCSIQGLAPSDKSDKYVMWSKLAERVIKEKVYSVVVIGEATLTNIEDSKSQDVIIIHAISESGEEHRFMQLFHIDKDEVTFGDFIEDMELMSYYLDPVRRAWGI